VRRLSMRIRPIPLALRRLGLPAESRSRYARNLSRDDAREMLKKITGEDFGCDVKKWREWIKQYMTLDGRFR
jgi:hypothetical protein